MQGIKLEERRKQVEGETDDPFTRRKTKPRLGNTKVRVIRDLKIKP